MRRRRSLAALAAAAAAVVGARAATTAPKGARRLGVLLFDSEQSWSWLAPELRQALSGFGWIEDANLKTAWRYADGEAARLPALAATLASSGVDAILTRGTPATRALQQATRTLPIVTGVGDPVGSGFARTLARPGGNITGLSYAAVETARKQLELLREMVPRLTRLTIVLKADRQPFGDVQTHAVASAARENGIATRVLLVSDVTDLSRELPHMPGQGAHAAHVGGLGAAVDAKDLAAALLHANVPAVFEYRFYVDAGGLMSYRLNWDNQIERTAAQIDKVLRGENPAQIPFEFPTRSEFVINAGTAKALGLNLPRAVLLRADEVIE